VNYYTNDVMTIKICKCRKRTDKESNISVLLNKRHKKHVSSLTLTSRCHLWIHACVSIEKTTIMRKKTKPFPTSAIKEENCDQEIKIKD